MNHGQLWVIVLPNTELFNTLDCGCSMSPESKKEKKLCVVVCFFHAY